MKYNKPPLTIEEQIELLISRGLIVEDKGYAVNILKRINYYRFSAYCIPFQNQKDSFQINTKFEDVYKLYRFDHDLRMLVFDALERIEIALRSSITFFFAHAYGAFGYTSYTNFDKSFKQKHKGWLKNIEEEIKRSKEVFIQHYMTKYKKSRHLPIWMASEVFSFGSLSQLFSALKLSDQKQIAKKYKIPREVFRSWIHTLVYARNISAHHARLWNKVLAIQPQIPHKDREWTTPFIIDNQRSFALFSILNYLLKDIDGEFILKEALISIFSKYKDINYKAMGFPDNWQNHEIWK